MNNTKNVCRIEYEPGYLNLSIAVLKFFIEFLDALEGPIYSKGRLDLRLAHGFCFLRRFLPDIVSELRSCQSLNEKFSKEMEARDRTEEQVSAFRASLLKSFKP